MLLREVAAAMAAGATVEVVTAVGIFMVAATAGGISAVAGTSAAAGISVAGGTSAAGRLRGRVFAAIVLSPYGR
jgi:hypothetical protein